MVNKGKGRHPDQTMPSFVIDLADESENNIPFSQLTPVPRNGAGPSRPKSNSNSNNNFLEPNKGNKMLKHMQGPADNNISNRENAYVNKEAVSGNESGPNVIDGGFIDVTHDEWNLQKHGEKKGRRLIAQRQLDAIDAKRNEEYQRKVMVDRLRRVQRDAAGVAEIIGITDQDFQKLGLKAVRKKFALLEKWLEEQEMTFDEMVAVLQGRRSKKTEREKLEAKYNQRSAVAHTTARDEPVYRLDSPIDVARQMRTWEFIRQLGRRNVPWRPLDAWRVVENVFFESLRLLSSDQAKKWKRNAWFEAEGPRESIRWYALPTHPADDLLPHRLEVLQWDKNSGGYRLFTFTVRGAEASRHETLRTSNGQYLRTVGLQFRTKQPKTSTGQKKPMLKLTQLKTRSRTNTNTKKNSKNRKTKNKKSKNTNNKNKKSKNTNNKKK